jgi:MoaA/NifB/PqqE/SkfB family radical SAM enzyme
MQSYAVAARRRVGDQPRLRRLVRPGVLERKRWTVMASTARVRRPLLYDARLWLATNGAGVMAPRRACPTDASLKLTENCQAKCVTCDYWRTRWVDHISTDAAIRLINELAAVGVTTLRFTGGEPLLRRDMFEILERADTSAFHTIGLQTNGLLLRRLAEQVNASPITHVTVSLDGVHERNDQVRGVRGYFDRAVDGLRQVNGKTLIIATTLTQLAALDLDELIDLVQELGGYLACNLPDNRLYFLQEAELDGLWPDSNDTRKIVTALRQRLGHQFTRYELAYIEKYLHSGTPQAERLNPPCVLGYTTIYVGSDGAVRSGCYVLPPVGNILERSIADILNDPAYVERCESMMRLECPGCGCNVFKSLRHKNLLQDRVRSVAPRLAAMAEG